MCKCVCVCARTSVCVVCLYTCTHTHACVFVCLCGCVCMCLYVCVYMHTCMFVRGGGGNCFTMKLVKPTSASRSTCRFICPLATSLSPCKAQRSLLVMHSSFLLPRPCFHTVPAQTKMVLQPLQTNVAAFSCDPLHPDLDHASAVPLYEASAE